MRRPMQLKGLDWSPGDARQRGSQRSKGVPGVYTRLHEVLAGLPSALSKQLANLQAGGDNLVDTITNESRRFTDVKNHEITRR